MSVQFLLRQPPLPGCAGERVGVRGQYSTSDIPLTLTLSPEGGEGMVRA